jgi:hypothetical protein
MPKYTSLTTLLSDDRVYIHEVFDGTRFKLMELKGKLYALTYGYSKGKYRLSFEIEAELASLGAYAIETSLYWEV